MSELLERVKVVLSAVVTWLVVAQTMLIVFADEIAKGFPMQAETVAMWSLIVMGMLGTAIAIIRRVTPVLPVFYGLLPTAEWKAREKMINEKLSEEFYVGRDSKDDGLSTYGLIAFVVIVAVVLVALALGIFGFSAGK